MSEWISVTKRLPDPIDRYVLVSGVDPKLYGHREFHVCALDDDDHGFTGPASEWRWMTEAGRVISEVTHWMPLPEPPK